MTERFISPLAEETQRRLWRDLDDNEAGILTRVLDSVDDWRFAENGSKYRERFQSLHLVSATFIHSSLRAPNSVYHENQGEWNYAIPALMIGSKFRREHIAVENKTADQPFVDCALYYPLNAGTQQLGLTEGGVDANGKGCHRDDMKKLCYKNNTCSELLNLDCSCDSTKVPPHEIGNHFAELFSNLAKGTYYGNFYSRTVCSYPGTEQGLKDMIVASNSLWKHRHGWCLYDEQECHVSSERMYRGHTECMASRNIMNVDMIDGILIQMPPRIFERQTELLQLYPNLFMFLLARLHQLYKWGYTELPIVFMEEVKGMPSSEACQRYWGGVDCQVGYHKRVYTQALNFSNGACIASPPGCSEVYYFPPDKHTGMCVPILQNKTCHSEKDIIMLPPDDASLQISSFSGYLLVIVWLVVLLYSNKRRAARWKVHVLPVQIALEMSKIEGSGRRCRE